MIPDLKYIFSKFGSIYHRSLMVLDNYHNINVPEPKTPVITRRLIPGKLTLSDIPKTSYYQYKVVFGWFPSTSQIINGTLSQTSYDPNSCPISRYLTGVDRYTWTDLCTKLNFFTFSSFTKPWDMTANFIILA